MNRDHIKISPFNSARAVKRALNRTHNKLKLGLLYLSTRFRTRDARDKIPSLTDARNRVYEAYQPPVDIWAKLKLKPISCDLSIILPIYNAEHHLRGCLESVLDQKTNFSYEIICVDDGSTDSSSEILDAYSSSSQMRVVRQPNAGVSMARNRGIEAAGGKYIAFIDNDDRLSDGFVESLVRAADNNKSDIVKCGHVIVESSKPDWAVVERNRSIRIKRKERVELFKLNGYVWGMIIRRDLFRSISFPVSSWYEDIITRLLLYALCDNFTYVPEPLYYHRIHENSASNKVWSAASNKALDQIYLVEQLFALSKRTGVRFDATLCFAYQYEIGKMLFERTRYLDIELRKAVFAIAAELNGHLVNECSEYATGGDLGERLLSRAFRRLDFDLWERACASIS